MAAALQRHGGAERFGAHAQLFDSFSPFAFRVEGRRLACTVGPRLGDAGPAGIAELKLDGQEGPALWPALEGLRAGESR
jgi:hypothetical protein